MELLVLQGSRGMGLRHAHPFVHRLTAGAVTLATLTFASFAVAEAEEVSQKGPTVASETQPRGSVFVDPLGFLLFGPTLGVELAAGQFSMAAYGRWLNVGVLAKELFLNDNDQFGFSFGGGLKGRYYFKPGLVGPHVGLALEFLKTRTTNDVSDTAVNNTIFIPEVEGGYRFGLGRFYIGVSAGVGYAIQASSSVENINGGNQAQYYKAEDVSTLYGSASLDLGVLF